MDYYRYTSTLQEQLKAERRQERRFHVIMGSCFGLFFVGLIGVCVYAFNIADKAHHRFMTQCMEDHKEYECTAMWRAGNRDAPEVVFIPSGR